MAIEEKLIKFYLVTKSILDQIEKNLYVLLWTSQIKAK